MGAIDSRDVSYKDVFRIRRLVRLFQFGSLIIIAPVYIFPFSGYIDRVMFPVYFLSSPLLDC